MSIDWKQVAEQADWGIAIGSADALVMEQMNPAFACMHGYTVAELTGMPIRAVFAPEVRAELASHIERAHELGRYRFESLHLHRDGHVFPVLIDITTVKNADGSVLYRIVNVQDISEQKRIDAVLRLAQQELLVREKFLSNLYEDAPVATAICEPGGRYISVNRAMCEMLGYSQAELLTMTFIDVSHPDDVDQNIALRQQLLASARSRFEMEKRYVRKDGHILWAHMAISLMTDGNGKPLYTIGQMINIDKEKLMEEQLAAAHEQRDTLVREVHHRIKNNLQSVVGLLHRQKLANPAIGGALTNAIQQVEAIAIVHGLQSSKQRGHLQLCDILAEIVAAANALNIEYRSIVLYNELQRPLLIAEQETVPLALVLNELITNAVKYADPTCEVDVTVTMRRIEADSAVVTIENPVHTLSGAFDFESGNGLGMGLKLVRSLLPRVGVRIQYIRLANILKTEIWLTPPVVCSVDVNQFHPIKFERL